MLYRTICLCMLLVAAIAFRPDETVHSLVDSEHQHGPGQHAEAFNQFVNEIADFLEGESSDRNQDLVFHKTEQPTKQLPLRTLNRHTFAENVVGGITSGDYSVEQWMVRFCPASWPECKQLQSSFEDLAGDWEAKLNTDVGARRIRFAMVDCATDKELCNAEGVIDYPTVHHYRKGKRLDGFIGAGNDFEKWLEQRLSIKREERQESISDNSSPNHEGEATSDVLLLATILALNAWGICYSIHARQARTYPDSVSAPRLQQQQ